MGAVDARPHAALGQVGTQVGAGQEGRAEGERRLQAAVRLGRRHLEETGRDGGGNNSYGKQTTALVCWL